MFATDDTIVAVATPPGRGSIGVVRLSGKDASVIAGRLLDRSAGLEARRATRARVVEGVADRRLRSVDDVIATRFVSPDSYTGEDVVEISGHGSPVLLQRIVALAVAYGARLAEPGEFTLRAYLNGKIDLIQAEAVRDLVDAVTPRQARAAMDQLDGTLTSEIGDIERRLFELCAKLEASVDFPEEGFHFITPPDVAAALDDVRRALDALIRRGRAGKLLREGRRVVIAGRPNTGKSTLFNALVGADRAIVTGTPGTTRDLIAERVDLEGVPVTLVDTAGVRESQDDVEREGIARAVSARDAADVVVVVLDGSVDLTHEDHSLLQETAALPRWIVINKSDLGEAWPPEAVAGASSGTIRVSAKTGEGVRELAHAIVGDVLEIDDERDEPAVTNMRHIALLSDAAAAIGRARAAAVSAGEELVLAEVHDARRMLELVTGRRTTDDLLVEIFARFCIGK
jgi:tRNA modification GTPase